MQTNQPRRMAELTRRRPPGPISYWLIVKNQNTWIEVLILYRGGKVEMLPVFSFEEEAEMFLGPKGVDEGWRTRESSVGELISVLCGPCARVKEVALDPSPEMVVDRSVGLVSLDRERFVDRVLARTRKPLNLWGPEE